ncbi:hypothetical protein ON010_g6673 [Phytophthora cinnamomi]|nr:hypothetical protein ON010_g6673 [Phytophthora cinnamomi]
MATLLSLDTVKIRAAFANAPSSYYAYIRSIYERSLEHVLIETSLTVFVIYTTFGKRDKPKGTAVKLSEREIDALCDLWTPETIIPPSAMVGDVEFKHLVTYPTATPSDRSAKLTKAIAPTTQEEREAMKEVPYQDVVGRIIQFLSNPGKEYWKAAVRGLKSLSGTTDQGLLLGGPLSADANNFADHLTAYKTQTMLIVLTREGRLADTLR